MRFRIYLATAFWAMTFDFALATDVKHENEDRHVINTLLTIKDEEQNTGNPALLQNVTFKIVGSQNISVSYEKGSRLSKTPGPRTLYRQTMRRSSRGRRGARIENDIEKGERLQRETSTMSRRAESDRRTRKGSERNAGKGSGNMGQPSAGKGGKGSKDGSKDSSKGMGVGKGMGAGMGKGSQKSMGKGSKKGKGKGTTGNTLWHVVQEERDLGMFNSLASSGTLFDEEVLRNPRLSTVFAPTNNAFDEMDKELLDRLVLPEWILHRRYLLNAHATDNVLYAADLTVGRIIPTLL